MSTTIAPTRHRAWSLFDVRVVAARQLTPNMVRLTVAAASLADRAARPDARGRTSLAHFADCGFDQRIKVILPTEPGADIPLRDPDRWHKDLRALPADRRPAARTYTVRAVRQPGRPDAEIDIDLVLHGTDGPASAWAVSALDAVAAGKPDERTRVTLVGPDARFPDDPGGRAFVTSRRHDLLIAGDETALPAIAAIVERLDRSATGTVLIEVPTAHDVMPLDAPAGVRVSFLPRDGAANGAPLVAAARQWRPAASAGAASASAASASAASASAATPGSDRDEAAWDTPAWETLAWETLAWDVPDAGDAGAIRAWVAGEAAAVRAIRRHLVDTCALRRDEVAFMGYWRLGRSET